MARRPFVRSVRRSTAWVASPAEAAGTMIPASSAVLLQTVVPQQSGLTVIRIRGQYLIQSDQVVGSELVLGAVGIGKVTVNAVAVGISAIPHPGADADWDGWMYHSFFSQ